MRKRECRKGEIERNKMGNIWSLRVRWKTKSGLKEVVTDFGEGRNDKTGFPGVLAVDDTQSLVKNRIRENFRAYRTV